MSREIKFRAYFPGNNLIGNVTELEGSNDGYKFYRVLAECFEDGRQQFYSSSNFILLQFTGLHDKAGVEIYEHDICKILYTDWVSKSHDDPRTLDQYLDDIAKVGVIEYCQDGFYFVTKDRHGEKNYSHINPGAHGFIKVIANIYQHPNLLES